MDDPNKPYTVEEMYNHAQKLASDLLSLTVQQRENELTKLRQKNAVLHALVIKELNKLRGQARGQE